MLPSRVLSRYTALLVGLLALLWAVTPAAAQAPSFEPVPAGRAASAGLADGGVTDVDGVELVHHLPTKQSFQVEVRGNYAYAVMGPVLEVFDVSDPAAPVLTGYLPFAARPPRGDYVNVFELVLAGQFAYVLVDYQVRVISLSDPARPVEVQDAAPADVYVDFLHGNGDYLYGGTYERVVIWQIQPDGALVQVGESRPVADATIINLATAGAVGYATLIVTDADYNARFDLAVLDLTDPRAPRLVATFEGQGGVHMVTTPDRLYVLGAYYQPNVITIFDRSNPQQLVEIGQVSDRSGSYAIRAAAWQDKLLLAYDYQLQVMDLAGPFDGSPPPTAFYPTLPATAVTVADNRAYIMAGGLRIYDATQLPKLDVLGQFNTFLEYPNDLYLREDHAFVGGGNGLHVVAIGNPSAPVQVAHLPGPIAGWIEQLCAGGDTLYAVNSYNRTLIDIGTPRRPGVIGYDQGEAITTCAIAGDRIYLIRVSPYANGSSEVITYALVVMDISTPTLWQELGRVELSGPAADLAVNNGRAYVSTIDGLEVIDVEDPARLRRVGVHPEFWPQSRLLVEDNLLFLVDQFNQYGASIQVVDVTQRDTPVLRSVVQLGPQANELYLNAASSAPYLYALNATEGLYVLDLTEPSLPLEAGRYHTTGGGNAVAVGDDLIGVTRVNAGLFLYRFAPPDVTRQLGPGGGSLEAEDVRYTLPAGFVSVPISFTHAPRTLGPGSVLPPLAATAVVFRNSAADVTTGESVATGAPYTMTIRYAGLSGAFPLDTLRLYRWTDTGWEAQESTNDPARQEVTATSAHFGTFALLAEPYALRLPLIYAVPSQVEPFPAEPIPAEPISPD